MKQEYLPSIFISFLFSLFAISVFLLSNKIKQEHIRRLHLFSLIFMYVIFAVICWNRFMNLNSDWGKELGEPLKLLSGKALYKDIYWPYGPLAPYINMYLYKLFGVHLVTIETAALSLNIIMLLLTYRLSVNLMQPKFAFLAAYLSFATSIASKHNLMPYTFSSLYAAIFSCLTLILIIKHIEKQKKQIYYLALAAASLGITVIAKHSMGILLLISCVIFLAIAKNNFKNMLVFFSSFLIITIMGYGSFILTVPLEQLKEQLFLPSYITKGYQDTAFPDTLRIVTFKYHVSAHGVAALPLPVSLYFAGLYWIPFVAAITTGYNVIRHLIQKDKQIDLKIMLVLIYFFIGNIQSASWVHLLFLGFILWPLVFFAANFNKKIIAFTITFLICYASLGLAANIFTFLKRNTPVRTSLGSFFVEPDMAPAITQTLNLLNKHQVPQKGILALEDANIFYFLYHTYSPVPMGIPFWHIIQTKKQQEGYINSLEKQKLTYILTPGWDTVGRETRNVYPWLFKYIDKHYLPIEKISVPKWNGLTLFTKK